MYKYTQRELYRLHFGAFTFFNKGMVKVTNMKEITMSTKQNYIEHYQIHRLEFYPSLLFFLHSRGWISILQRTFFHPFFFISSSFLLGTVAESEAGSIPGAIYCLGESSRKWGIRPLISFPVLKSLIYNWHITLSKFKLCNLVIWYIYSIMMWLPPRPITQSQHMIIITFLW